MFSIKFKNQSKNKIDTCFYTLIMVDCIRTWSLDRSVVFVSIFSYFSIIKWTEQKNYTIQYGFDFTYNFFLNKNTFHTKHVDYFSLYPPSPVYKTTTLDITNVLQVISKKNKQKKLVGVKHQNEKLVKSLNWMWSYKLITASSKKMIHRNVSSHKTKTIYTTSSAHSGHSKTDKRTRVITTTGSLLISCSNY